MYRPIQQSINRHELQPAVSYEQYQLCVEESYSVEARAERMRREDASTVDQAKLRLHRAGLVALSGTEQQLLKQVMYPGTSMQRNTAVNEL